MANIKEYYNHKQHINEPTLSHCSKWQRGNTDSRSNDWVPSLFRKLLNPRDTKSGILDATLLRGLASK